MLGEVDHMLYVSGDVNSTFVKAGLLEGDPIQVQLAIFDPFRSLPNRLQANGGLSVGVGAFCLDMS